MPEFRKGAEAIAKAQENAKSGGGNFQAFTPEFFWKDKDEKYLLFLNPLSEIVTADLISFIPVTGKKANGEKYTRFERVIARTDAVIDESHDEMVDKWDGKARETCVAVAVELEPTYEEVKGRKRPTGFAVKTREFDRRIRDEDDELTDEYETVEAPELGIVHASPHNFFNVVTAYDNNDAPIEETPLKITRVGGDTSTVYTVSGYPELADIDLAPLVENIENFNYLYSEMDDVLKGIEGLEDHEAVAFIGEILLAKRLDELVDRERYEKLLDGIDESLDRFGGGGKDKAKKTSKSERPARRSQRRSAPKADAEESADAEPEQEEAPKTRRTRSASASAAEAEVDEGIAKLRERVNKRKTASAA